MKVTVSTLLRQRQRERYAVPLTQYVKILNSELGKKYILFIVLFQQYYRNTKLQ
jgi:hypothetical protein